MKRKCIALSLLVLSIFSLSYFVMLTIKIGPAFRFNYVWLLMGLCLLGISLVLFLSKRGFDWIPKPLLLGIEIIVLIGCACFIIVEAFIIVKGHKSTKMEADFLIVLGAKVNGTNPSLILKYRIEEADKYLQEHPDTKVVVSGGKGPDEGISEAEAMKNGLLKRGIDENRIIIEDKSTSTKENLAFSKEYIDCEKDKVLVVTTDFHVMRAVGIAKQEGYEQVDGLPAKSVWYLIPTNYLREFLAVIKDKIVGNL